MLCREAEFTRWCCTSPSYFMKALCYVLSKMHLFFSYFNISKIGMHHTVSVGKGGLMLLLPSHEHQNLRVDVSSSEGNPRDSSRASLMLEKPRLCGIAQHQKLHDSEIKRHWTRNVKRNTLNNLFQLYFPF